jgi:hypothetical protein
VHARKAGVPEDQRESLDEPQQRVGVLLILFDGRHRRLALSAVHSFLKLVSAQPPSAGDVV